MIEDVRRHKHLVQWSEKNLYRVVSIIAVAIAVVLSLLSFPAILTWVLLFWFVVFTYCLVRNHERSAAAAILFAAFVALLRGPFCAALAWYTMVVVVAALFTVACSKRSERARIRGYRGLFIVVLAATLAFGFDRTGWPRIESRRAIGATARENGPIICLGDSLTSGLPGVGGYPPELMSILHQPVENFGREGFTTEDAFALLPQIEQSQPSAIVIELGGHDFLKGKSRRETKQNLLHVIEQCKLTGGRVILCEIPRGFIVDPFYGLEREIAREQRVQLIPDSMIRKLVLLSPYAPPGLWLPKRFRFSDDGLHPNPRGNQMLAAVIAKYVR